MKTLARMLIFTAFYFLVFLGTSNAQVQVSGQAGVATSINLGESVYSPIFKSIFIAGDKIRFENDLVYNLASKLESGKGWSVGEKINLLLFVNKNLFLNTGLKYTYRDGGNWVKTVAFYELGAGYEGAIKPEDIRFYLRGSFKRQFYYTLLDNEIWGTDFVYRIDYKTSKKLGLRVELNQGFIRYTQIVRPVNPFGYGSIKRMTGFYSDGFVGLVYRIKN